LRRFRFEACFVTAIVESSMNSSTCARRPKQQGRLCTRTLQGRAACRNASQMRRVPTHEPQTPCNNRFHEHRMNDMVRFPPDSSCRLRQPRADPHRNHCQCRRCEIPAPVTRVHFRNFKSKSGTRKPGTSAPIPKFASLCCTLVCGLRNRHIMFL
jgi:hypothetical protein